MFVGPRNEAPICVGCFGKLGKNVKTCQNCGISICCEKCANADGHQLECEFMQVELIEDFSILSPLRFLGMKRKDEKLYKKMTSLVSHRETKVLFEVKQKLNSSTKHRFHKISNESPQIWCDSAT